MHIRMAAGLSSQSSPCVWEHQRCHDEPLIQTHCPCSFLDKKIRVNFPDQGKAFALPACLLAQGAPSYQVEAVALSPV